MSVWKRSYVWCVVLIPFVVRNSEYDNGIRVIFCCLSSLVYGIFGFFFVVRVGISDSFLFVRECMSNRSLEPNILSLENGEWKSLIKVEHVTGEEKYK